MLCFPYSTLGEKIGEGAFGYAVNAVEKKTGSKRAVKVISKPSLGDDEVVGIKNEVRLPREIVFLLRASS